MPEPLVRRSTERGVTIVTLDSPANRNALSTRLVTELSDALSEADVDKSSAQHAADNRPHHATHGLFVR